MATQLLVDRVDHVESSPLRTARFGDVTRHIVRVYEDREELRVDASRPEPRKVGVHAEVSGVDLGKEPTDRTEPVERGIPLAGSRTVHAEVETEIEDEGGHVIVAVDHDGFFVEALHPGSQVRLITRRGDAGRRP